MNTKENPKTNFETGRLSTTQKTILATGGLFAVGLLALYAEYKIRQHGQEDPFARPQAESPLSEATLTVYEDASPEVVNHVFEENKTINRDYYQQRESFSEEQMKSKAIGVTIAKVSLINKTQPQGFATFENKDLSEAIISVPGRDLDLKNPTHLAIGAAYIDYVFQKSFLEEEIEKGQSHLFPQEIQILNQGGREDLFWLLDNFEIEIGDVPPIQRTENFQQLAKYIKSLQDTGYELPKKIRIGNYFETIDQAYDESDGQTIFVDNINNQVGYFSPERTITDYLLAKNPDLLSKYKEKMDTAYNQIDGVITEPELLSPDHYGYIDEDPESLRTVLYSYLLDGVSFRKKIDYAREKGFLAELGVLVANYEFAKELFGGREYMVDGKKVELQNYQTGDIVNIEDYEYPDRPGIYLREIPTLVFDPNGNITGHGAEIRIAEGPAWFFNEYDYEATRMWRIEEGQIANGRVFVPYENQIGWISEEWLGEKIELPR